MKIYRKKFYRHKFDFDLGYLVKSPCRGCDNRATFPKCIESCDTICRIQDYLSDTVSCSRGFASLEGFASTKEGWEGK